MGSNINGLTEMETDSETKIFHNLNHASKNCILYVDRCRLGSRGEVVG